MPGIKPGLLLWTPAPAAAEVALEEIRTVRLKRSNSFHIFVCPRLMEPQWWAHLHKSADLVFEIPAGADCWPTAMFEPLTVGLYFPYLTHRPWELQRLPFSRGTGKAPARAVEKGRSVPGACSAGTSNQSGILSKCVAEVGIQNATLLQNAWSSM